MIKLKKRNTEAELKKKTLFMKKPVYCPGWLAKLAGWLN